MNIYCPKCGIENDSGVRYCRKCGVEIEAVAALLEGRLVVSKEGKPKGLLGKPGWEKALIAFSLGVAMLILGFILGFDHSTGSPTPGLGLLILAFPLIGYGVGQMVRLSSGPEAPTVRAEERSAFSERDTKELPEIRTDYVSPSSGRAVRDEEVVPHSVVESTTRNLGPKESSDTSPLEKPSEN
ncbi:MAG: zinc ribbon domain-containing protein [Aridibacter famidurans]|nr:zinc ribbon domain-containing protein [Aridibacter famidurans]